MLGLQKKQAGKTNKTTTTRLFGRNVIDIKKGLARKIAFQASFWRPLFEAKTAEPHKTAHTQPEGDKSTKFLLMESISGQYNMLFPQKVVAPQRSSMNPTDTVLTMITKSSVSVEKKDIDNNDHVDVVTNSKRRF